MAAHEGHGWCWQDRMCLSLCLCSVLVCMIPISDSLVRGSLKSSNKPFIGIAVLRWFWLLQCGGRGPDSVLNFTAYQLCHLSDLTSMGFTFLTFKIEIIQGIQGHSGIYGKTPSQPTNQPTNLSTHPTNLLINQPTNQPNPPTLPSTPNTHSACLVRLCWASVRMTQAK